MGLRRDVKLTYEMKKLQLYLHGLRLNVWEVGKKNSDG